MMQVGFDYIERWLKRFEEAPLLVFWESTKACPLAFSLYGR
jgi:MoaA/NifB/PqqE/SkfB family radical SAM enzyme